MCCGKLNCKVPLCTCNWANAIFSQVVLGWSLIVFLMFAYSCKICSYVYLWIDTVCRSVWIDKLRWTQTVAWFLSSLCLLVCLVAVLLSWFARGKLAGGGVNLILGWGLVEVWQRAKLCHLKRAVCRHLRYKRMCLYTYVWTKQTADSKNQ